MAPHYSGEGSRGSASGAASAISQLSRLGLAATTAAAQSLLIQGQDWQPCGALQRAGKLGPTAHWFADAAWVKPAALVAAWLAHPRITLRVGAQVQHVQRLPGATAMWQALDAQSAVLAQGDAMVLANAYQAATLLDRLSLSQPARMQAAPLARAPTAPLPGSHPWLHQVAGQVIFGPWSAEWQALWPQLLPELAHLTQASHPGQPPICAINGNGHFIPAVPWGLDGKQIWLSGSTYEHDAPQHPQVTARGLTANLQRLQQLLPAAAELLAEQHRAGQLQGWAGTRCTTRDRLPAVGAISPAIAPGLYACTAMGSRGLSFAALCGQHVAALVLESDVSPLPAHLHGAIGITRLAR